jgi:5-methylthioadenosine/S-adenosylhomocysteine deaminase
MKRILITGGRTVDASGKADALDLLVEDGVIRALTPPGTIAAEDVERVDATDRLLVPGLVNGHTHGHGALGKGLVEDRVPLEVFLSASGAINGGRRVEEKYLSAALSAVELVRRGCTACYDLSVEYPLPSPEGVFAVARAYMDVGIRAVVAPMMADRSLFEALPGLMEATPPELQEGARRAAAGPFPASLEACRRILGEWPFDRGRIRPALAPTIPLHCSDDFLAGCRDLVREFDVPLQMHVAETRTQAAVGQHRYGRSLVAHLGELGLLSERFSAAHAIWIDDDDIRRLADSGSAVVHNPMSNLRIGSGVAPVRRCLDHGVRVGIGTDASNTSDGQNMFEATRLASFLSRIATPDYRRWLSVEEVFAMATTGSAGVLGFSDIGRIAPGCKADIVFLDLRHITYVPLRRPLLQTIHAESGAAVASVMIDGRMVLDAGRILTIEEAKLRRDAEEAAVRLDAQNAPTQGFARAIADVVGTFCMGQARQFERAQRLLSAAHYQ